MSGALYPTVFVLVIGLQTYWMSRSLGRVEASVDRLDGRLDGLSGRIDDFRAEVHRDLTTHTEAIADLRERVARLGTG